MPASKRFRKSRDQHFLLSACLSNMMTGGLQLATFSCDSLKQILDLAANDSSPSSSSNNFLLLDCRPFLIHNDTHIINSINIHCPAILRRRTGGRLPFRTVIPDASIRDRLLEDFYYPIILYEENDVTTESIAVYVAKCLQDVGIKTIHILEGGFLRFGQKYPFYCTKGSSVPVPLGTSTTSNISSRSPVGNHTWPLKSTPKGFLTPRTPKKNNLNVDMAPLSFGNDQAEPVEILPYLYLGSEYHASCKSMLKNLGITALLNVSHTCPNLFEDCFTYKSIPVEDSKSEDISIWFNEAIEFIDSVKASNGKVLVHCHAGISRSATICMAYLMATKRLRMEEAYEFVKSRRKIISPNFNFMGQLLGFETQVFSPNNAKNRSQPLMFPPPSPIRTCFMAAKDFSASQPSTVKYRINSAPSSPNRIRSSEAQRLVFDFTQVPISSSTIQFSPPPMLDSCLDSENSSQRNHFKTSMENCNNTTVLS